MGQVELLNHWRYLKPFNYVQTMNNIALTYLIEMLENILIELLVLNNNT